MYTTFRVAGRRMLMIGSDDFIDVFLLSNVVLLRGKGALLWVCHSTLAVRITTIPPIFRNIKL